jgi:hypothetical protein
MSAVDEQFGTMPSRLQNRFLTNLSEEILRRRPEAKEKISEFKVGWLAAYVDAPEARLVLEHQLDRGWVGPERAGLGEELGEFFFHSC